MSLGDTATVNWPTKACPGCGSTNSLNLHSDSGGELAKEGSLVELIEGGGKTLGALLLEAGTSAWDRLDCSKCNNRSLGCEHCQSAWVVAEYPALGEKVQCPNPSCGFALV